MQDGLITARGCLAGPKVRRRPLSLWLAGSTAQTGVKVFLPDANDPLEAVCPGNPVICLMFK